MLHRKYFVFIFVLMSALCAGTAVAQTQFGRYLGTLQHSQIEQDQLAKLDFVVARQSSSEFRLIAVLTLYFGDYSSKEYVSYHFDSVTYNVLTGSLVFDQPDQDITLVADHFANGRFEGRVRATSAGDVGTIKMSLDSSVAPTRPLVQPLWGEYRGVCDEVTTVLQIQTHRSNGDAGRMGNPFGTFETSAQLAEVTPGGCGDTSLCVARVYDSGSYNYFAGKLDLLGRSRNLSCDVTSTGLRCENCALRRTSGESAAAGVQAFPIHAGGYSSVPQPGGSEPAAKSEVTQLSGTYSGYLFHELLGVYQAVSLNIVTYQKPSADGTPALVISAVSSMYFGGHESVEYINQRFNEKEYPLLAPQIVLERLDSDVDTTIQLTELGNGRARGIWYSTLFGRVGTFELSNTSIPAPPAGATVMAKIGGRYQGGGWDLDLRVVRESTPPNTVNPFYPLNFKGAFRLQDITPNIRIADGVFDFYTGKLGMRLENESLFSGFRLNNNQLALKRPTPGIIRPLTPHRMQIFEKVAP